MIKKILLFMLLMFSISSVSAIDYYNNSNFSNTINESEFGEVFNQSVQVPTDGTAGNYQTLTYTGTVFESGIFTSFNLDTTGTASTWNIEVQNSLSEIIFTQNVTPTTSEQRFEFTANDYLKPLVKDETYTLTIDRVSGTNNFRGRNVQTTSNTYLNISGRGIESGEIEFYYSNFNGSLDLYNYIFSGNYTNQTRFDGTLNGYTFNDGTLKNFTDTSRTQSINSSYGGSLEFDGVDDYIDTNFDSVPNNTSFSVSFWFKHNGSSLNEDFLEKGVGSNFILFRKLNNNNLRFQIFDGSTSISRTSGNSFVDNQWHNIIGVVDRENDELNFYVDGIQQGSTGDISGINTLNPINNWVIGDDVLSGNFLNGSIDNLIIYDVSLNSSEVLEQYNSVLPIKRAVAYYSFDENIGDTLYDTNHLVKGVVASPGIVDTQNNLFNRTPQAKGMAFDGVDDYVSLGDIDLNKNWSISLWLNTIDSTNTGQQRFISKSGAFYCQLINNANYRIDCSFTGTNPSYNVGTGTSLDTNTNEHIVIQRTDDELRYYINDVSIYNVTVTGDITLNSNSLDLGEIGRLINGSVDDLRIYQKVLNSTEISQLYNNTYLDTSNLVAHYTFQELNNDKIHDRNNAICIICTEATISYNVTQEGLYTNAYFDELTGSVNNQFFFMDFTNPNLEVNFPSELNDFTINLSNYINYSDLESGVSSCIVSVSTGQTTNCNNESFTFSSIGNKTINVTVTDIASNTNSSLNSLVLINPYVSTYFNDISLNPITNFTFGGRSDNNTGLVQYKYYNDNLKIGSNTLEFEALGYETQTFNFTILSTPPALNQTFNATDSLISIQIKDKETGNLITGTNFTAEFIATVGATTSTTNGYINISNPFFLNEDYTVIISNANYQTESLFFTFTNRELLELEVFMIEKNNTQLGQVFIEAVDRFSQPIVGATVEALQWNPSSSAYERVSTSKTGSDGTGALNIILEDKSYIFRATSNGAVGTIDEGIIESSENGKTITIVVSDTTSEENYLLQNLFTNVTQSYNNVTNISTVNFQWEDLEGLSQEVCINAYRRIATTETLISENCVSGVSGTYMQSFFINSSYTTILKGEIKVNGEDLITIKSFKFNPEDHPSTLFELNGLHLVIIPVLFLVSIAAGMFMENIYIGTFLLMISSGLSLLLAPTLTNGGITAFFFFLGFMIIRSGVKIK